MREKIERLDFDVEVLGLLLYLLEIEPQENILARISNSSNFKN